ncbi:MAG: hypothetical protein K0R57_5985 [Paenibacillaceae bacterium]|nr:hypothetical protein [Paenibacillaceae bacterium]
MNKTHRQCLGRTVLTLAVLFWMGMCLSMQAAAAGEADVQLAGSAITGTDIYVAGDRAVWVNAGTDGGIEIKFRNLTTGEERLVAAGAQRKQAPVISGEWVIWSDKNTHAASSAYWDIIGFNLATNERKVLNQDDGQLAGPSIDGTDVVWFDMDGHGTLHSYDLAKDRGRPLGQGRYPKVSGGNVVYKNPLDGGISMIHLATNQRTPLYVPGGGQYVSWFDYNGSQVLWKEADSQGATKYVLLHAEQLNSYPQDLTVYSVKGTEYGFLELGETQGVWMEDVNGTPVIRAVQLAAPEVFTVTEATGGRRILGLSGDKLLVAQADGSLVLHAVKAEADAGGGPGTGPGTGPGEEEPGTETGEGTLGSGGGVPESSMYVRQTIGPAGGKLALAGGEAELNIPSGALSGDAVMELRRTGAEDEALKALHQLNRNIVAGYWQISSTQELAKKAELSVSIAAVSQTPQEWERTGIYRYDQALKSWQYAGGYKNGDRLEAGITRPGLYAVLVNGMPFADLEGHWAREAVEWLAMRSVVDGMEADRYMPESLLTRAQFVKMLVDAEGFPLTRDRSGTFRDVTAGHWAEPWIEAAASLGLANGVGDGLFEPDRPLAREEMMTLLVRATVAAGHQETVISAQEAAKTLEPFTDAPSVSGWAVSFAAAAVRNGWIEGDGKHLNPAAPTTRAEAAAVIKRLLDPVE